MEKKNTGVDLLNGPVLKSLVLFTLPFLGSLAFQLLYNMVDTVIVGHFMGDTSLAAIGVCSPVYELLIGFGIGVGNGFSLVTARFFGMKDDERLRKSVASALVLGLALSLLITAGAQLFLRRLLLLLGTPQEILEEAYSYISTVTMFTVVLFAYNLFAGMMRAIGNSFMPFIFLVISSLMNVVLDFLLVVGLGMGIRGAALATVLSQGMSAVLSLFYMVRRCGILIPEKEHFKPSLSLYLELLEQGLSMGLMSSIVAIGTVILQSGINSLGVLVIAAHTSARKLFSLGVMPFSAFGMAAGPFASQNMGADHPERVRRGLRDMILCSLVLNTMITLLNWLLAPQAIWLLSGSSEAEVISSGALYLRLNAPFYILVSCIVGARNMLQGLGQKVRTLVSSCIELLGKVLFVWLLVPRFGYMAVIFCEPVIWFFMAVYLLYSFYHDPFVVSGKAAA